MKAIVYRQYATPPALEIADVSNPVLKADEVLVRVKAAGLNPLDLAISSGVLRMVTGNRFPKRLGADFSGEIVEVGGDVMASRIGDEVFAYHLDIKGLTGTLAEFLAIKAGAVAAKPKTLSHAVAAGMPCVYQTALQGLRDVGRLRPGARTLIYGASGGVGTAAVQIAKHMGAHVTTISSDRTRSHCLENGADVAIAHDRGSPWAKLEGKFDLIFQVYQTRENLFRTGRNHLAKGGRYIVSPRPEFWFLNFADVLTGRFKMFAVRNRRKDLDEIAEFADSGVIRLNPKLFRFEDFQTAFANILDLRGANKTVLVVGD